jgi:hypothetical protein
MTLRTGVLITGRTVSTVERMEEWARDLAEDLLKEALPRRWAHTAGVAARAESLAPILGAETGTLTAAAWLHDIGYAPALIDTGFHPLDGARYLRDVRRADDTLVRLVAHHTCAEYEAAERGLSAELGEEFDKERPELVEALVYCDMTTDPDGRPVPVETRLAEIRSRYGPGHLVTRSITRATPCIVAAVRAVQTALEARD